MAEEEAEAEVEVDEAAEAGEEEVALEEAEEVEASEEDEEVVVSEGEDIKCNIFSAWLQHSLLWIGNLFLEQVLMIQKSNGSCRQRCVRTEVLP